MAPGARGIAFVRAAGTVYTPPSRSISVHSARPTSPRRAGHQAYRSLTSPHRGPASLLCRESSCPQGTGRHIASPSVALSRNPLRSTPRIVSNQPALPGLGLSPWASARVKRTFNYCAKVQGRLGFTDAQAAAALLRGAGITDVQIVRAHGVLSDHSNPVTKKAGALRAGLCVGFHRRRRRDHARGGACYPVCAALRAALGALGTGANSLHRFEPRLWCHGHRLSPHYLGRSCSLA